MSVDYIHSLVEEGKIYLFQIYNKDFSPYSKGTPNLHTLYWKMLFDESNLTDVVYKLNGQAEVFFRKSSITFERPTHPANQAIDNKNTLNMKKQSVFTYDLIKDRRYTVDKFQFHVPITMNFKSTGNDNINQSVNEYIQKCRGELSVQNILSGANGGMPDSPLTDEVITLTVNDKMEEYMFLGMDADYHHRFCESGIYHRSWCG